MSRSMMEVTLESVGPSKLEGVLRLPEAAIGLVIFAHGAGSSSLSPRNNHDAEALGRRGIATLLFDLLTEEKARDRANVFDIPLLSARMAEAIDWTQSVPRVMTCSPEKSLLLAQSVCRT